MNLSKLIISYAEPLNVQILKGTKNTRHKIGIHLANPDHDEIVDAIQVAERDMFPAIYIYDVKEF